MNNFKPHISEKKKKELVRIKKLIKEYPIIGIIDLTGLSSAQMQAMKKLLRKDVFITLTKKRLIKIALDEEKGIKGIEKLKDYLKGIPCLLLSKENPFKIAKIINENKSSVAAKPGQIAPNDIVIKAGPTQFTPGPIIGELGAIGIKTEVQEGKIIIKEDTTIVKEDEEISQKVTDILAKLDIQPMEVGLNIVGILENGIVYDKSVLSIDQSEYISNLQTASQESMNLAVFTGYITKDTIDILLKKAILDSKALAKSKNIKTDESIKESLSEAETQAEALKEKVQIHVEEKPKEEVKPEELKKEIKEEPKEKKPEPKKEEPEKPSEPEKEPENIVEEAIEKVKKHPEPLKEEPPKQKGPTEEDIKATEEFVKDLIDGKIKGTIDSKKQTLKEKKEKKESEEEKKRKEEKEFREAEKKAKEILGQL